MKVLLTGGTGLVGRRLIDRLAPDHDLVVVARSTPEDSAGAEWIRHDLAGPLDLSALPGNVDAVVHLAQSDRYRDFPDGAEDVFAVNVESTSALLRYARGAGAARFVLASSGGVYERGAEPVNEDTPLGTPGPYFRSKRMAELLVEDYAELLHAIVLRFFFIYGPGDGMTLIPRLTKQILGDEEIVIQGDPGMRMNPLFVDDAAAAIDAALSLDRGAVVNVAGEETVTVAELVQRLGAALGREPRVRHEPGPESPTDLVADTTRMREVLGVRPATKLDAGLKATAGSPAGA